MYNARVWAILAGCLWGGGGGGWEGGRVEGEVMQTGGSEETERVE